MKASALAALLLAAAFSLQAALIDGKITLSDKDFQPGAHTDMTGQWLYRPGYTVGQNEKPENEASTDGYVRVGVPQFLNRIHWWLDDSVDFDKHETDRLKALGFDTDRAEDGWYRAAVELSSLPNGRHLFLEFEGVAMKCKVYCNGHRLGDHEGMFSRFSFDLTPHLRSGANQIAIFVSMEKIQPSALSMGQAVTVNLTASKVKTLSKGMYGPMWAGASNRDYDLHGIWQPVSLVARAGGQIDDVWFNPSTNGCDVKVKAHLMGTQAARIIANWVDDKTGIPLAQIESATDNAHIGDISQTLVVRDLKPRLWTPAEPNLYRLKVELRGGDGELLDEWNGKVGFRTFEIRGNHFYLSGHPWWLRGANHLPYGKNPWDPKLPRKLIQYLHDANVTITRTHATPWNETWLKAADEIGLAVSIEGIRPWGLSGQIGPTPPDMFQDWLTENQDVIERCRNHPSVFIYTVGNEMMLRDPKNLEKWKQLSTIVKQTRDIDPTRPVIASSEYSRDPEFYNKVLKPNGIDDGDIDDLHRYNNWYAPSTFVTNSEFVNETKRNRGVRPLMGQEMSTGYPDLDTGLPVFRYTHDLITPLAWVGFNSYLGSDPAIFLEHDRAVTKRWAEQMRFQRSTNTAGFMLFAAECWFSHSYDAAKLSPYPVIDALRQADAPVGLALETGRRRFYAGEKLDTAVFIIDDDNDYRNFQDSKLEAIFPDGRSDLLATVPRLDYFTTIRVPVQIIFPPVNGLRQKFSLRLRLKDAYETVSETSDPIELFPTPAPPVAGNSLDGRSLGPELSKIGASYPVIAFGPDAMLDDLAEGKETRLQIEAGKTAIVFSPGKDIVKLFPEAARDSRKVVAEYADFFPCAGTSLTTGLQAMDLKWWGRPNDNRVFVASMAQRLQTNGPARELIRYIPPHGYIAAERIPEQYLTVMWELRLGKGRLWICDLDLEQCATVDPVARLFAENLFRAAADRNSTAILPRIPTHEELCRGRTEK